MTSILSSRWLKGPADVTGSDKSDTACVARLLFILLSLAVIRWRWTKGPITQSVGPAGRLLLEHRWERDFVPLAAAEGFGSTWMQDNEDFTGVE